jgi:hypothetical protein
MFPPLPEIPGESQQAPLKRFGRALLAVPKSKIMPEENLPKLGSQKQRIDAKLADVRRFLAKRKEEPSSRS